MSAGIEHLVRVRDANGRLVARESFALRDAAMSFADAWLCEGNRVFVEARRGLRPLRPAGRRTDEVRASAASIRVGAARPDEI